MFAFLKKRVLIYSVVAILIALSLVLLFWQPNPTSSPKKTDSMDSFMTDAQGVNFNKEGLIQDTIRSPSLKHYSLSNTAVAVKPRIISQGKIGPAWHISADHGRITHENQLVYLWGNVKIVQPPGANSRNLTLLTSALTYYPAKKIAKTNEAVTIIQPGLTVHGIGMNVNMDTGQLKLLKKTTAQYIPTGHNTKTEKNSTR